MKHGSSGVVALPVDYRRFYGLRPGEVVRVLYDSLLLIVPKDAEKIAEEKRELINRLLGAGNEKIQSRA
jgi:bifunctional DNA-binding transcriptional regulator/antitoxin component of YhaV-PrlF toxin-antitoxin module